MQTSLRCDPDCAETLWMRMIKQTFLNSSGKPIGIVMIANRTEDVDVALLLRSLGVVVNGSGNN